MNDDTDLMNQHHVAGYLGKFVEELDPLPVSSYHRWVVFLKKQQKAR